VQRLPRYVLLLQELVKYSNPTHPKYMVLRNSLEAVKNVANFVNEAKMHAENSQKLLTIQESLVGKRAVTILEPQRKFFNEGDLKWHNSSWKEPRELHYILCSDCLLLATPEKGFFQSATKLKLKLLAPLNSVDIQEVLDLNDPDKKFTIVTPKKSYLVNLDAGTDRDEWIKVFYWLRSGSGPRYEKVADEVERRHMRRSGTLAALKSRPTRDDKKPIAAATLPRKLAAQMAADGKSEAIDKNNNSNSSKDNTDANKHSNSSTAGITDNGPAPKVSKPSLSFINFSRK